MSLPAETHQYIQKLLSSASPKEQLSLREGIRDKNYYTHIWNIYLNNPFLKLTDEEVEVFKQKPSTDLINQIILARDAASKRVFPKISVFCMPKSGSSFVQSALRHALELPMVSMTSVANPGQSSFFGMNSREQELDEFSIVKSILLSEKGFVSQNHTRCSMYLVHQLKFYNIFSVLTIRNILDCIISFDDMMVSWRSKNIDNSWISDAQFSLPMEYPKMDDHDRYNILSRSFGIWLISFYISWKRFIDRKSVNPILLKYEEDILDTDRFIEKVTSRIMMSEVQKDRLRKYAVKPDTTKARLNVGIQGRGQKIETSVVDFLLDYARRFSSELSDEEIRYLIR